MVRYLICRLKRTPLIRSRSKHDRLKSELDTI